MAFDGKTPGVTSVSRPHFIVIDADPALALLAGDGLRIPAHTRRLTAHARGVVVALSVLYVLAFLASFALPHLWRPGSWGWLFTIAAVLWGASGLDVSRGARWLGLLDGARALPLETAGTAAVLGIALAALGSSPWLVGWSGSVAALGLLQWARRTLAGKAIERLAVSDAAARQELMDAGVIRVAY
jgi:hypothetical protein